MANGTPCVMWFLPVLLDVAGTETDWCPGGKWTPMSLDEFCYRRACCGAKPYCFLMNTDFHYFTHEMVEKYMKRSGVFGMFPSFFSADAATQHYFKQPDLYERDRPLFKKYMPIIKKVAEEGWKPITKAVSSEKYIHLERFGERYITLLNTRSDIPAEGVVTLYLNHASEVVDEYTGNVYPVDNHGIQIHLGPEDCAVLNLFPGAE